ncbi:restriction endonuclease subunit S [Phocaeicola vulgatus]|uniref:restriction endonuclease subunit S n=4 Tax=Bacteroides fragilis TaxID=817 RepID=UPI000451D8DB|nr:restriction endonuclease subunit S [Bacteroides fragilis]EYA10570.1 type I restriction modification DNA specificity domain protein [Bacteroides fragilis str. S6R6]MCE9397337.1 restriction endonuclease subunit S [Bacteroides fragilis]MDB0825673.1 restriction endonuclease subunit S [Phocaeicola vulgatus]
MANNNENKILNVPNLRFPEFCGEWETIKVSELLDFYSTNSLSWEQLDYSNGKIKNLHYGLIHKGVPTMVDVACDSLPYIKEESMLKSFTLFKEGDVAFADASEDTNDVAKAIEVVNCDNQQIVSGLHTIHGRDNSNRTVIGYKGYAFASDSFHKQIRRIAQGTKVFSISVRNFDEAYIGIPSKEEQTQIAKLLITIDKRIATQNKIIDKLKSLIKGLPHKMAEIGLQKGCWEKVLLSTVLVERKELNSELYTVHSVSVSEGVINQIEYLGRSFAAKDTSNYHVARYGDIIYTKSPTGDFPYGIVKQSYIEQPVAISPLYGVYSPTSFETGVYLHYYFMSSVLAKNYLYPLIQKGAKNTINISNQRFLENRIALPLKQTDRHNIARALITIQKKLDIEKCAMDSLTKQRSYLLQQLFI